MRNVEWREAREKWPPSFGIDRGVFNMKEKEISTCHKCGKDISPPSTADWVAGTAFKYHGEVYCSDCFIDEFSKCFHCGGIFPKSQMTFEKGGKYCGTCYNDLFGECPECANIFKRDDMVNVDGNLYCSRCYNDLFSQCDRCHRDFREDDSIYVNGETLCPDCAHSCPSCGKKVEAPGEYCSLQCAISRNKDYPAYWQTRFVPSFQGRSKRVFGVELEIDKGYDEDFTIEAIYTHAIDSKTKQPLVLCKHDGSIDNGFEIVTEPCSLHYHQNKFPWKTIIKIVKDRGYKSHGTKTCGLHVHINETSFGKTQLEQDAAIARLILMFDRLWAQMVKLSRRTGYQIDQWASQYLIDFEGDTENQNDLIKKIKSKSGESRYLCINLEHPNTVEFRLWRGTLHVPTIIATIQLCNLLSNMACSSSVLQAAQMKWSTLKRKISTSKYQELKQYVRERNL